MLLLCVLLVLLASSSRILPSSFLAMRPAVSIPKIGVFDDWHHESPSFAFVSATRISSLKDCKGAQP